METAPNTSVAVELVAVAGCESVNVSVVPRVTPVMVVPPAMFVELPITMPTVGVKLAGKLDARMLTDVLPNVVEPTPPEVGGAKVTWTVFVDVAPVEAERVRTPALIAVIVEPAVTLVPLTPMPTMRPLVLGGVMVEPVAGTLATVSTISGVRVMGPAPDRTTLIAPVPLLTSWLLMVWVLALV